MLFQHRSSRRGTPVASLALFVGLLSNVHAKLQTESCSYNRLHIDDETGGAWCIDVHAQAEAPFELPEIFPNGAKFVRAIDGYSTLSRRNGGWPNTLSAFWVEYDEIGVAEEIPFNYVTEFRVFYTDKDENPGGGDGRCETLLGATCLEQLNEAIRKALVAEKDVLTPIPSLKADDAPACPDDMWTRQSETVDDRNLGTLNFKGHTFMWEQRSNSDGSYSSQYFPSGNWSYTYRRTWHRGVSMTEQAGISAVMMIARYPELSSRGGFGTGIESRNESSLPLISTAFACAKATDEAVDQSDEDNGGSGGGNTGSRTAGQGWALLGSLVAAAGVAVVLAVA